MAGAYELYSSYLFSKAGERGIPLSGTFELTARCNLDCRMCYIHRRAHDAAALAGERPAGWWLDMAEECSRRGMLLLLLTGGEPLLRPDFREIYSGCRRRGLLVSVNSNATLMDDDMVDFFAADPPARVNITLYGASPETYGALCGDPTAYERVVKAILALQSRGVLVKLNFSITRENRQDAPAVYAFAKEHGLVIQAVSYLFPPARACELGCCETARLSPEEAAAEQLVYDRSRFTPEELRRRWSDQLRGVRVPEPDTECQELPTERIRCRAGSSTFWLTWDGKLRPCGMMTAPSADVSGAADFKPAWESLRQSREAILVPVKCTACGLRHVCDQCPAVCAAETGSFTEAPPYLCAKSEAYLRLIRAASEQG